MPLLDHSQDKRSRGIPPLMVVWILLLVTVVAVGVVYFVRTLSTSQFATGHISGFHAQDDLTFVHYAMAVDGFGVRRLDLLIFESGERRKLVPDLQVSATPQSQFFVQIPQYTVLQGSREIARMAPGNPAGNMFKWEDGKLNAAGLRVSLSQWEAYEARYRQIGTGDLDIRNLQDFTESPDTPEIVD